MHDAETVLLVDDRETEIPELDGFFDQRVGAHEKVDLARAQRRPQRSPRALRSPARQEGEAVAASPEPAGERLGVLFREDLRRRHQRRLRAVLGREERGEERDRGLAAPDVPLQQPGHRRAAPEVGADLRGRPFLRLRQRERQQVDEPSRRLRRPGPGSDGDRAPPLPAFLHELRKREQFLPRDRSAGAGRGRFEIGPRRKMNIPQGLKQLRRVRSRPGLRVEAAEESRDRSTSPFSGELADPAIDPDDPAEVNGILALLVHDLVLRVLQDERGLLGLRGAVQDDPPSGRQGAGEVRAVEPGDADRSTLVLDDGPEDREAAPPGSDEASVHDARGDGRGPPLVQVGDARERGTVFVPERQVEQQVPGRFEARGGELAAGRRRDGRFFPERIGESQGRADFW